MSVAFRAHMLEKLLASPVAASKPHTRPLLEDQADIALRIDKLSKRFPGAKEWSVRDFSLSVPRGSLVALLGPSGCGKTTTLRMIAGLVEPTGGEIFLESRKVNNIPAHRRNIGLVFQHYALFPLLNVFENVAYGLRERRVPEADVQRRVAEALAMVHLSELSRRKPKELSGGQQQRVALARALVINPSLLLLDEPLSNLDAKLRHQVRGEIKRLQEKLGITTLFVTHDQEEALSLAQTVVVMRDGQIEQAGRPEEIYQQPESSFVADFVGSCNFINVTVTGRRDGMLRCAIERTPLELDVADDSSVPVGAHLLLAVRPESLGVAEADQVSSNSWLGVVCDATYLGPVTNYDIEIAPGVRLLAVAINKGTTSFGKGSTVAIGWSDSAWRIVR